MLSDDFFIKLMSNYGNKIVHDYEGIKFNLIWDIIKQDLKQLRSNLEEIIENEIIE